MSQNRRQAPRIFFEDKVVYETANLSIVTVAYDISPRAIFVKTLRPLPPKSQVTLHIPNLNSKKPKRKVKARGEVVATRNSDGFPRGMVIMFDMKDSGNFRHLLKRYLRDNRFYVADPNFLKSMYQMEPEILDLQDPDLDL